MTGAGSAPRVRVRSVPGLALRLMRSAVGRSRAVDAPAGGPFGGAEVDR
jgi:hypothetical protein